MQSHLLAATGRLFSYTVEPGPARRPLPAPAGPYDLRLGYARIPEFVDRLTRSGYRVSAQAEGPPILRHMAGRVVYPPYREKTQAGLEILDRRGEALLAARFPRRAYPDFDSIPPLVVKTLLFIENRAILDEAHRYRNPAIDWPRLGKAILDLGRSRLEPGHPVSGGSTLATQLEKLRHSPGGRTAGVSDKARQIASASLRAYLDGADTRETRKRIIRDYLNSLPLATMPGYGEVTGLGDGLHVWFGEDFESVNRLLAETRRDDRARPAERARAYRRVLALLLALKKPTTYLVQDRAALDARIDAYLRLLAREGIIDAERRDAALRVPTGLRDVPPEPEPIPFADRKAADAVRAELLSRLGLATPYELDRLDLAVGTTIDGRAQRAVSAVLRDLGGGEPKARGGLTGPMLLGSGDPRAVVYSVSLFERTAAGNVLRVEADNFDRPLNINEGTRLELGSTAKLRTLVHYLEIVAELHARYATERPGRLRALRAEAADPLTEWALAHLSETADRGLPAMLAAAMERRYSASPAQLFFTGGGVHRFANFDRSDDARVMTVSEAFRRSVNLVFIRLMRDIVEYHVHRLPGYSDALLENPDDPRRTTYLLRFADQEGGLFLSRFHRAHRGRSPDEMLEALATRPGVAGSATRLAVIFRSVRPREGPDRLAAFLRAHRAGGTLTDEAIRKLYERYGPDKFGLADRGYLAGVHPLELWLVEFLQRNPQASLERVLAASAQARREAYAWLFKTGRKAAQDRRIRTVLEIDAFARIHRAWRRLGYPFDRLVPSYATAIGSSGDNPAALSVLAGIIVNDGVLRPTLRIQALRFGVGTPYETAMAAVPAGGVRVLAPEIAAAVRRELSGVVTEGTARRMAGATLPDGRPLRIGGKTGTGDNRRERFGPGAALIGSRVLNRTAAFVFTIDDRFFGTVLAFVPGPRAASHEFTSALPVQLLRNLLPALAPVVSGAPAGGSAAAG